MASGRFRLYQEAPVVIAKRRTFQSPSPLCSSIVSAGFTSPPPPVQEKQPAAQCVLCKEVCCAACARAAQHSAGDLALQHSRAFFHSFTPVHTFLQHICQDSGAGFADVWLGTAHILFASLALQANMVQALQQQCAQ